MHRFPLFLFVLLLTPVAAATDAPPLFTGASVQTVDDASLDLIRTRALRDAQPDAMYVLAMLSFYGQRVDRDVPSAVRLLQRLAQDHDHRDAQFTLGVLYTRGTDSLRRDDRRAAAWLAASANRGHADAAWVLAGLYNDGRGVARDAQRALALLEAVATRDDAPPRALFHLGVMYEYGHGGATQDATRAAALYHAASEQRVAEATYFLALLYASGRGVALNPTKAMHLLSQAADQGHAAAMLRLGELHADGVRGVVAVDYAAAREWYERAAHAATGSGETHLQTLAQQRATQLSSLLAAAEQRVRAYEAQLHGPRLHVHVATIDG